MSEKMLQEAITKSHERLEEASLLFGGHYYSGSVSRSYYAILDAARAALMVEKVYPKTHSGTLHKFNQLFIKSGKFPQKFNTIISHAQKERSEADYNFLAHITEQDANDILESAKDFVKAVEDYVGKNSTS